MKRNETKILFENILKEHAKQEITEFERTRKFVTEECDIEMIETIDKIIGEHLTQKTETY
jgi:hypothetical protein